MELFKQRATLLYEDVGDSYIGTVLAARSMELWLLEDMGFAVVAKFSVNAGAGKVCLNQERTAHLKGAAEAMLTNEIVLRVFADYLTRDADFEVIHTSKGYSVLGFDNRR